MANCKNPKYPGLLKKCIKCLINDRKSKHHHCLYCAKCKAELDKIAQLKSSLQWKKNNREYLNEYRRQNYYKWKDNINKYQRDNNKDLTDTYLRGIIARGSSLSSKDITNEMIEMKRLLVKLARIIKLKSST